MVRPAGGATPPALGCNRRCRAQTNPDGSAPRDSPGTSPGDCAFGDPNDTSFTDGGNEIWKYAYAYGTPTAASFVPVVGIFAGGVNVDKKTLTILFDKNGVVVRHTMSSSHEQVQRGG